MTKARWLQKNERQARHTAIMCDTSVGEAALGIVGAHRQCSMSLLVAPMKKLRAGSTAARWGAKSAPAAAAVEAMADRAIS